MEESLGAQYAIQIAVHTLRDRCKTLQQRLSELEEENINLRIQCSRNSVNENSLSELDKLRAQVSELTEQKNQAENKIKMVSMENQELWSKLGKLIRVNKNLGDQLKTINETVSHAVTTPLPHVALIRSKTFTQDEPHTRFLQKNLEMNEKISMELENVSLKLSDSFSKQKMELEKICSEIELESCDNIITENFGFCFDGEEDDLVDEFKYVIEDLKLLHDEVLAQKKVLESNIRNVEDCLKSKVCHSCDIRPSLDEKATSTHDLDKILLDKSTQVQHIVNEEKIKLATQAQPQEAEKICPICTRLFRKDIDFQIFQQHVEDHFNPDVSSYELL